MSSVKGLGAASRQLLEASVLAAPHPGVGDAFSFEQAAGKAIEQMRDACKTFALPPAEQITVTYIFCDDLEKLADPDIFDEVNLVWTSDTSIQISHLANRIVLISRNGAAGCISKSTFSLFRDQARFVKQLNLLHSSAIAFQLNACEATVYPHGMGSGNFEKRPFGTISSLLSENALEIFLDFFDDKWVNSPPGHKKLWANIPHCAYVPCEHTEKVIQENMHLALMMADRSMVVIDEVWNADGRADFHIYTGTPGSDGSVVLELKVLRQFSHPKDPKSTVLKEVANATNKKNALEVVKQAAQYKDELQAKRALARLYDMRRPPIAKEASESADILAKQLDVEFKVSQINYTVQEKRDAKVQNKITNKH